MLRCFECGIISNLVRSTRRMNALHAMFDGQTNQHLAVRDPKARSIKMYNLRQVTFLSCIIAWVGVNFATPASAQPMNDECERRISISCDGAATVEP